MTLTDSPTRSDFTPPRDPAALLAWLDEQIDVMTEMLTAEMTRIAATAVDRYLATVAAGDPRVMDGMESAWAEFVTVKVDPYVGMLHRAGSLTAWVGANPPSTAAKFWTPVVNQEAVDYAKKASNRIVGAGNDVWWKVRSKVTGAVRDGVPQEKLKQQVEQITGYSEFRADTIARTETMMAYNAGDHIGATALGEFGPAEKQWLSTEDARTRESHSEANGQCVPFADPFMVGGNAMPYPGSGPPEEVINCRCVVLHLYPGDTRPDGSVVGERAADVVNPPPVDPETQARQEFSTKLGEARAQIKPLKAWDRVTDGRPSKALRDMETKVRRAGDLVDKEATRRLEAEGFYPQQKAEKMLRTVQDAASERFNEAMKRAAREAGYDDMWTYIDEVHGTFGKARQSLRAIDAEYDKLAAQADKLWEAKPVTYETAYRDAVRKIIDEERGMWNGVRDPNAVNYYGSARYADEVYGNAMRAMPQDWVDASTRAGRVTINDVDGSNRGWHQWLYGDSKVHIPFGRKGDVGLHVHEMTHRMEKVVPGLSEQEWAFLHRRAGDEGIKTLRELTGNPNYRANEVAFGDKFSSPYMGKVYEDRPDAAFEVLTMGMENLERGGALDPDYRRWLLGILVGL